MRLSPAFAALFFGLATACSPGGSGVPVPGAGVGGGSTGRTACGKRCAGSSGGSSTGGSSAGSTGGSSGGLAGGSGSSSGGSSGAVCGAGFDAGSNGKLFDCGQLSIPGAGPGSCTASWFETRAVDVSSCLPLCGAEIQLLDGNAIPIASATGVTDPVSGVAEVCLPNGQVYTPQMWPTGYKEVNFAEVVADGGFLLNELAMIESSTASIVTGFLSASPSEGVLFVFLNTDSRNCDPAVAGWSLSLALPDGGPWPDGGAKLSYLGANSTPDPSLTATGLSGLAVFFDIDTSISNFVSLVAVPPPDAGACGVSLNASLGLTGRVLVGGNQFSETEVVLP